MSFLWLALVSPTCNERQKKAAHRRNLSPSNLLVSGYDGFYPLGSGPSIEEFLTCYYPFIANCCMMRSVFFFFFFWYLLSPWLRGDRPATDLPLVPLDLSRRLGSRLLSIHRWCPCSCPAPDLNRGPLGPNSGPQGSQLFWCNQRGPLLRMQPGSFSSLPDMQCNTESNYQMDGSLAQDHNVGLCPSDAVAGEGNCSHPSNTDCGCSTGCVYSTNCGYYTNYYVHPRGGQSCTAQQYLEFSKTRRTHRGQSVSASEMHGKCARELNNLPWCVNIQLPKTENSNAVFFTPVNYHRVPR